MFVWAAAVEVVMGSSFSLYSISYVPRGVVVSYPRTFTRTVSNYNEFPSLSLRRICFFLYIGDFFNVCMIQLYIYTTRVCEITSITSDQGLAGVMAYFALCPA
jgi:hypothetical protein